MSERQEGVTYLTHKQAAAFVHMTPKALYAYNTAGTGPERSRIGRANLYAVADLIKWVESRKVPRSA